ncbi:N-acetylglucosaminyldiphosphoundecaprenol N-acetyl-beta-D-mannosaminyltransferase [Ruminiclostridium sufflavum DSM 19573]|uniref:N-acetylglucosaminyldiphosphoundecaprenol N-acetyl-beta-D-mannosaminyltransferase n=1 Tax=Ruminiclostridium sufflavum DSM 19573 TaxID=1121337 RepID=A0A318XQM8_9FIRM|nr:WecB/TagA/CpsF family glycosyltransferase [Ruminiclostridium sufflavum]PYG88192.1 N-acetylglucosaminyldiphosphoundecaprenol N-acetyl-beta-D-mannosaminyltransferase [Ruminiclostridium sufflavum DSM 19573]
MRKIVNIAGINIDDITMEQAVKKIYHFISSDKSHAIYTPNSEIMMDGISDSQMRQVLNTADMLVADGAGVVLASKILGKAVRQKVSGVDLAKNLLKSSSKKPIRFFLFGGKPGIAEKAQANIICDYPYADVVGTRNGYFSEEDTEKIIEEINNSSAEVLFVCLGAPKQELWIHENKDKLKAKVCMGVGGTLDVLAGNVKLAPDFFRNHGLEWLYRLYKEPRRFKRMLKLPKFILYVIGIRLKLIKIK